MNKTTRTLIALLYIMPLVLLSQNNDCSTSVPICTDGQISFNPNGIGNDDDLGFGATSGCLLDGENNSAWYYFEMNASTPVGSILGFVITPDAAFGEDYDFALYGPGSDCNNLGAPLRCSYADAYCIFCPQTGLGNGALDISEDTDGDGFVSNIVVNANEGYYLLIDNYNGSGSGFSLEWTGSGAQYLNCAIVCDIKLSIDPITPLCEVTGPINLNLNVTTSLPNYNVMWETSANASTWINDLTIEDPTITIPPSFIGAETFNVTVSNDDGTCLITDSIMIQVSNGPMLNVLDSVMIGCDDINGITLGADIVEDPQYTYTWLENGVNIGSGTSLPVNTMGTYILDVSNGGCSIQDTAWVTGGNNGFVDLSIGNDTVVEEGALLNFDLLTNLNASQIVSTDWTFNGSSICQQCDDVSLAAENSGTLTLQLIDDMGCPHTASLLIIVNAVNTKYYIPNIFSPNNDGINDVFSVYYSEGIEEVIEIRVFNRWGAEVFSAENATSGVIAWDGKFKGVDLNPGVFSYYAILRKTNLNNLMVKGDITILR